MNNRTQDPDTEPVEITIDGILDLHLFNPRDVKHLVPHYLEECAKREIVEVRIIHGKGTGVLRERVHALLGKCPLVTSFSLANGSGGSWGATVVRLSPVKRGKKR